MNMFLNVKSLAIYTSTICANFCKIGYYFPNIERISLIGHSEIEDVDAIHHDMPKLRYAYFDKHTLKREDIYIFIICNPNARVEYE